MNCQNYSLVEFHDIDFCLCFCYTFSWNSIKKDGFYASLLYRSQVDCKKQNAYFRPKKTVTALLDKGVDTFLFGGLGEFDNLAWEIVTELKNKHPQIKRVYVRATYPSIEKAYEKYLLRSYEHTFFPTRLEKAGKSAYVERNFEMIDLSTYCIFYYNHSYTAYKNRSINGTLIARNSGTKIAYEYAAKRNKEIINLYK